MKKIRIIFVMCIFICAMGFSKNVYGADSVKINSTNVKLYGLDTWSKSYLKIPKSKNTKFQLKVTGASNVTYTVVSGNSVTVSEKGVIKPKYEVWYWNGGIGSTWPTGAEGETVEKSLITGKSIVKVTAGNKSFDVNVNVKDYAVSYAENKMDTYIKKNIKSSMSGYQKIESICKFVAGYDYRVDASGAISMIVKGGGDCWASTDAVITMCEKTGIDAWVRNGNKDPGAGSGHKNVMVHVDGKYYEVDAGYSGSAPRYYSIKKRDSLFSYRYVDGGVGVYQYDGKTKNKKTLTIPNKINGQKVVVICDDFFQLNDTVTKISIPDTVTTIGDSAFNSCTALKSIKISKNVKSIGNFVFTNCKSLKEINCSSSNKYYSAKNGVLYNKKKTKLLYAPAVVNCTIPSSVKTIEDYSFYYNSNLKSVLVPSSVTSVGEGAFGDCPELKKVKVNGNKLTNIENYAFYNCNKITVLCKKGTKLEQYLKDNNIKYRAS